MSTMRAKVRVSNVVVSKNSNEETVGEKLTFNAVYKNQYDSTGLDEDNTFALYTPSAEFTINVVNPTLFGKFKLDQKYYVDFTGAE